MSRDAGFTLLEVLVALVVFGLLMAGLTQGVHLGLRAWQLQLRHVDASGELDAVDRSLRRLIGAIEPGHPNDPPNIVGNSRTLVFTSELPEAVADPSTRRADMALRADGAQLVLRWTPHLHVARLAAAPAPTDTVLLQGVVGLELAYRVDGAWRVAWNGRTPPDLVRIRLQFAPGDPRHWPDLLIAPSLRAPP